MSIGESDGGLPPDSLVEAEAAILDDMIRVVDRFHGAGEGAMCRVGLAPAFAACLCPTMALCKPVEKNYEMCVLF